MIKRRFIAVIFAFLCIVPLLGQNICKIGMRYQKSSDINWGIGCPVVINVWAESAAEKAGLAVGDIITKIDGIDTRNLNEEQINQLLMSDASQILLEIKSLKGIHDTILEKDCHRADAVSEAQLAQAFAFYSLRDANDRRLLYPIKTEKGKSFSFDNVKSFKFINSTNVEPNPQDSAIYSVISKILTSKGLYEDLYNPDIKIDIFYNLQEQKYSDDIEGINTSSYRYDFSIAKMVLLPILNVGMPNNISRYTLSFGLNIFDNHSNIVWTSQSSELLSEPLSIERYAKNILPLMLREFPFVISSNYPKYLFSKRHYNYTGIRYKVGEINHIAEVDDLSPAYKSGIRPGDKVLRINGIPISTIDQDKITRNYITFLKETDKYRQPIVDAFVDANGLANCRYWADDKFSDIAKLFMKNEYDTPFSYIFFFRKYINDTNHREIVFDIERNSEKYSVIVSPIEKEYTNITIE